MLQFQASNCTIIHDRVYAVPGIAPPSSSRSFKIDYEIPTADFLLQVHAMMSGEEVSRHFEELQVQLRVSQSELWDAFQPHKLRAFAQSYSGPSPKDRDQITDSIKNYGLSETFHRRRIPEFETLKHRLRAALIAPLLKDDLGGLYINPDDTWDDEHSLKAKAISSGYGESRFHRRLGRILKSQVQDHPNDAELYRADIISCHCAACEYYRGIHRLTHKNDIGKLLSDEGTELWAYFYKHETWAGAKHLEPTEQRVFYLGGKANAEVYLTSAMRNVATKIKECCFFFVPILAQWPTPGPYVDMYLHESLNMVVHHGNFEALSSQGFRYPSQHVKRM